MWILLSVLFLVSIFMFLLIVGADKCKSDEERRLEDEEQIEYINNWRKRK